jgi:hypothetical protein
MKIFLTKIWSGVKWVWAKIKAGAAFIVDFAKWCKTRKSDGGAQ